MNINDFYSIRLSVSGIEKKLDELFVLKNKVYNSHIYPIVVIDDSDQYSITEFVDKDSICKKISEKIKDLQKEIQEILNEETN